MNNFERNLSRDPTRPTPTIPAWDDPGGDVETALWESFARASTRETFCASWLAIQCNIIGGVSAGVVLWITSDGESFSPLAIWPNPRIDISHLTEPAGRAAKERRGLVVRHDTNACGANSPLTGYDVAFPVEVGQRLRGIVVLKVTPRSEAQLRSTLRKLQWGFAWLEVMIRGEDARKDSTPADGLQAPVDTFATRVGPEWSRGAAGFAAALATRLACDRVSIGFVHEGAIEVVALSHGAQSGQDAHLLNAISGAMREAIDQNRTLVFPLPDERDPRVTRAHAELSRQYGSGAICSVPIGCSSGFSGVVTLERPAERLFDAAAVKLCEDIIGVAGPILEIRQHEDQLIGGNAQDQVTHDHVSETGAQRGIAHSVAYIMASDPSRGERAPEIDWKNTLGGFSVPLPSKAGLTAQRHSNLAEFNALARPGELQSPD